jgi:hypothetical protein
VGFGGPKQKKTSGTKNRENTTQPTQMPTQPKKTQQTNQTWLNEDLPQAKNHCTRNTLTLIWTRDPKLNEHQQQN